MKGSDRVPRIALRYGINPRNSHSEVVLPDDNPAFTVLNGALGYINVLDALTAWQIASEAGDALHVPVAASIKHTNPVGLATSDPALPPDDPAARTSAYARARGCDPLASFGDFIGFSTTVDVSTAEYIARCVSHGIIAPAFEPEALEILRAKMKAST